MFCWAQYEATVNGVGYGQSQLLVMSDFPTKATIIGKHPIKMLAAPSGITHLNTRNGPISPEHLLQLDGNASLKTVPSRGMLHCKELWVIKNSML
jgi:hypothetical protein